MFNMSDLSIGLSIETSYTFQTKNTSLDSLALNPLEKLPRQDFVAHFYCPFYT